MSRFEIVAVLDCNYALDLAAGQSVCASELEMCVKVYVIGGHSSVT